MSNNYDFQYSIIDVVSALGLSIRRSNSSVMYVDCPYCEVNPRNGHDGKGKFEIVIAKNFGHCCRCNNPPKGEGMLNLYAYVRGCDVKQAHKEMLEYVGKAENKQTVINNRKRIQKAIIATESATSKAPNCILDRTYRAFLSELTLYKKHYKELTSKKRSLTPKFVKGFGFKSVPTDWRERSRVMNNLLNKGVRLEGVPGFFINRRGNWDFNCYSDGFLIPLVNTNGEIVGMQFKPDNPKDEKNKYICFSSPYKNKGTSSGSPIHLTSRKQTTTVFITEGGLKADIAYALSGKVFMSVQGVNCQKELEPTLKALKANGVKRIVDSFDADCKYNPNVEKARNQLKKLVESCGLKYFRLVWDMSYPNVEKELKGIDDYMIYVPKEKWQFSIVVSLKDFQ